MLLAINCNNTNIRGGWTRVKCVKGNGAVDAGGVEPPPGPRGPDGPKQEYNERWRRRPQCSP